MRVLISCGNPSASPAETFFSPCWSRNSHLQLLLALGISIRPLRRPAMLVLQSVNRPGPVFHRSEHCPLPVVESNFLIEARKFRIELSKTIRIERIIIWDVFGSSTFYNAFEFFQHLLPILFQSTQMKTYPPVVTSIFSWFSLIRWTDIRRMRDFL